MAVSPELPWIRREGAHETGEVDRRFFPQLLPWAKVHSGEMRWSPILLVATFVALASSCARHEGSYRPHSATAIVVNGRASVPRGAPLAVKRAITAANRIQGMPYKWGGGHARLNDWGYDCSGATSYVLRNAGLIQGQMPSRGFLRYGRRGHGDWITVCARNGHVFLLIAGLRFDTQGTYRQDGPRWRPYPRSTRGYVLRHPGGL